MGIIFDYIKKPLGNMMKTFVTTALIAALANAFE